MIKIIFVIIFTTFLFANSDFNISNLQYYKDETKNTKFEELINKDFTKADTQNFGFGDFAIWSKFELKNNLDKSENFYGINYRNTLDFIDVYVVYKDGFIEKYLLGDMRDFENKAISTRLIIFPVELKAKEEVTIFIRHENTRGVVEINWDIKNSKDTNRLIYLDSLFFGIFIGVVLMLLVLGLVLFFTLKNLFLLYYCGIAIFILLGQLTFNGILHSFDFGIPLKILSYPEIPLYFSALFIILFHYDFFDIQYQNKKLKIFIKFLIFIPIFFIIIDIILPSNLSGKIIPISILCHWFVTFSLIVIGIKMSLKGVEGGWFYVLGQSLAFLSSILVTIYIILSGDVAESWTYYSIVIGSFFNIICLAFALYIRLRKQQEDSLKKSEVLMELSKFHNSEMIINNIIHQWKLPLSRIIAILTDLQAQIYFGKNIEKTVVEELPEINKNAMLLAQIVQEFYKFNQSSEKTIFLYEEILDEIKKMLSSKIQEINAQIKLVLTDNKPICTDRFAISNISTIIINNFLDIAKIRKIKNPTIVISIKIENDLIKILFEDNCEGINFIPFEKVFEPFRSITDDKSKGLGLFIAKTLVEEKLQGKIQGYNSQNGAVFEIVF